MGLSDSASATILGLLMRIMTDGPSGIESPTLIHLTSCFENLASILREATVIAKNPFGAIYKHPDLRDTQRVACFSSAEFSVIPHLARRHGMYGLGLGGAWMKGQGAKPVNYVPKDTEVQRRFAEMVNRLAYGPNVALEHDLWERTPFIDYPKVADEGEFSKYDWRWEREWRVHGNVEIDPSHVQFLVAPQDEHEFVQETWKCEAVGPDYGSTPPMIDANWSLARKVEVICLGPTLVANELADLDRASWDEDIDTAPEPQTWISDDRLASLERIDEWSSWLDEMERDDN